LTHVQQIAYTREVLSRIRPSPPPEPASCIARALHRRLPERIRSPHALDVLARSGWLLDQLAEGRFISFFKLVHRVRPDFMALIARKLLEIGHGMRIGTLVEGIEEEAELSWVQENGADFVQGFLLGRPSPVVRR
jgi:hypothetical protein